ncbi:MAG: putative toxin-antitoxin system toxin component, PIN family [Deltaproteobacteria bacterium]|nr:MAG: putative toxin-antitoxin system toxin component, PIN family [Deltaproteobacteria bacterium]
MKIVLDTNVLVSSLLKTQSSSGKVLDLIISGHLELLIDDRILSEYREVLRRPKFLFDELLVDDVLATIDRFSTFVASENYSIHLPDRDDLPFLEVALSGKANALITGNKKDFGKPLQHLKIVSPSEFLKIFESQATILQ